MSGILIGVQVYLQEPIQLQTHTDTLIKYHLTICDCVCGKENKSTCRVLRLLSSMNLFSTSQRCRNAPKERSTYIFT